MLSPGLRATSLAMNSWDEGIVYLDNHATTPLDPAVLAAMKPWLGRQWGNPSSRTHAFGWAAREAIERARRQLADLLGARPQEIVWTSGATEAINLALRGVAQRRGFDCHIVTTAIEHKAVLDTCEALARLGVRWEAVPVGSDGRVDPDAIARALREDTALVSVMAANNEIGVVQPVADVVRVCRERGVTVHVDAAQVVGREPVDVQRWGADLVSMSGHKFYGPKGVGALWVRGTGTPVRLAPQLTGGGQEAGLRAGTHNVAGIVGMGAAAAVARAVLADERARIAALRDRMLAHLRAAFDDLVVHGSLEHRVAGNLSVSIPGVEGQALVGSLGDVALSTGSACTSGSSQPSHVLKALGVSDAVALSALRIGVGRFNTLEQIDRAAARLVAAARRLRRR